MDNGKKIKGRGIFITGTDTGMGKTVAAYVLGTLLQKQGLDVGVMKPVQCAGDDAAFLRRKLRLKDPLNKINPYLAPEPLSPNLAFKRQKTKIEIANIIREYEELKKKHDVLLIEGAGGLLVPITDDYLMADLIRDLDAELVIVSRLGLGTINHTLLTLEQARARGLKVKGIAFNTTSRKRGGIPEKTNPEIINRCGDVPVLGTIPYLNTMNRAEVLRKCLSKIDMKLLLSKNRNGKIKSRLKYHSVGGAKRLEKWDKKYLWHPFTQMKDYLNGNQLVIDEAKGCYLKDSRGNWYLDGVSSLWVNVHGHRKKNIDDALKKQIDKLGHSTLLGLSNTPAVELAKKLVSITSKNLTKVFYSDNGSTAVEVAIKIAYQYWQNTGQKKKTHIVHMANSYHGDTLGSVSIGGIDLFHKVYRDLVFKTIRFDFPDCYRAPKGKTYPKYAFEHLVKLEKLFQRRHGSIAAFVAEPLVQGAAGMIVWPKGVLKEVERICRKYDVLLILDEVATGFGRTGKMFAYEHEHVKPDILCLAKGLTGGYLPLAATLTTQRIYDGFLFDYKDQKTFFHGHTYTGNPLACAAALANLEIFDHEHTLHNLQPKIKFLRDQLKMFYNLPNVGDVRQKGFMVGIELVKSRKTKEPYPWKEKIGVDVCSTARKYGVILRPLGNVIVLMPPLAITTQELKRLLEVTYHAIKEVTAEK